MTVYCLDASALAALLLAEPGADRVAAVITDALMSTVNLGEVVSVFARRGIAEATVRQDLAAMPVTFVPFDEALAYRSGLLLALTKAAGLSFGDRACLALAERLGGTALTADRSWTKIAKTVGVNIEVIR